MATCIVTGGAGFLGSHMCEHLLERGHRVICIDNLDTGSLQNIEHIRSNAFEFVQHDLTERLADYPMLDEEDYSRLEYEATLENFADAAWRLKGEYDLPEGWEGDVFSWFWEHNQRAVENRDDQGGYPEEDDLRDAFEALGYERTED